MKKSYCEHLHRIVGQLQAIETMVNEDKPCLDLVQQIRAARSSLAGLERTVVADQIRASLSSDDKSDTIDKLLANLI